jgi:hypothetical protein
MDRFEPKHALFDNIEEMLSTDVLSDLLKQNILSVECRPFDSHDGFSGNTMSFMQAGDQKLVMKRLRPKYDWKSIASQDHRSRSVLVWQYGLLDRIRPHMEHKIIAALADTAILTIYISEVLDEEWHFTNRSSIWIQSSTRWQLRFHQGTPFTQA